ncbi:MAG TPA: DinB family protein [Blastocatellia bacterium]|nr:DinB family protein [Blastocatellia bacterium]
MKYHIRAFRYLASAFAICAALGLVCFAQQATGAAMQPVAKAAPADPVAALVADWTRARDYTKEYLDAMPEEGVSFKPTPDIRSFAEQMLHLASGNFGFAATALGIANPQQGKNLEKMDEYKTKAGLTKIVMESYDFVISSVKGMDVKKMDEPVKLFGRFDATRGSAMDKAFEHQTHHRGQTTIYLRLKGVKPPQEKLF